VTARLKPYSVTPLAPTHEVGAFACGDKDIDSFIAVRARREQEQQLSQVYVMTATSNQVLAYFTLSPLSIRITPPLLERLGIGAIPYPLVGGYLLGRLGVDQSIAGNGIGSALTIHAARIARNQARHVGGVLLAVDPKTDRLVTWYEKLGFIRLAPPPGARRVILPFASIP